MVWKINHKKEKLCLNIDITSLLFCLNKIIA